MITSDKLMNKGKEKDRSYSHSNIEKLQSKPIDSEPAFFEWDAEKTTLDIH
jgi:hypothetical protein